MSLNANEKIVAGNADASYLLYLITEYADTDLYSRIMSLCCMLYNSFVDLSIY